MTKMPDMQPCPGCSSPLYADGRGWNPDRSSGDRCGACNREISACLTCKTYYACNYPIFACGECQKRFGKTRIVSSPPLIWP